MKLCRKRSVCRECGKDILKGEYMVVGKLWQDRSTPEGVKHWTIMLRWHDMCWIEQARDAANKHKKVETRGTPALELSNDDANKRRRILRRRGSIIQRINTEIDKPHDERNIDNIIHLGEMLDGLKAEIEPYGGVPKSW